ncbi:MAG: roadblock/LC7 domain-containing protein [Candidatus Thermoplasmatota archaeon]|mgnify:CR=1 FL=1
MQRGGGTAIFGPSTRMPSQERLVAALRGLEQAEGVRGSAVADHQGLPIVSVFFEHLELPVLAAMSTLAVQSSRRVFEAVGFKALQSVLLEGPDGNLFICPLGDGRASLIIMLRPEANAGFVRLQAANVAKQLEEELDIAPLTDARIRHVFLISDGGLLISHLSRTLVHPNDRDILAGMLTAIQDFAKDALRSEGGGELREMDVGSLRAYLIRGRWCTLVLLAEGPLAERSVLAARDVLGNFEGRNEKALDPWDGQGESLVGLGELMDALLREDGVVSGGLS